MRHQRTCASALIALITIMTSCSSPTGAKLAEMKATLVPSTESTLKVMEEKDPSISKAIKDAYAYIVFPSIGTGGFIVGGAGGDGILYRGDSPIGLVELGQGTIGAQIGGGTYAELVLLENEKTYTAIIQNQFTLAAQATATGIDKGAGSAAKYSDGVAIIVMPLKGLMAQAAIGGQQFTVTPFN